MTTLNLIQLFTALGRVGRNLYLINQSQGLQPVTYSELSGYGYITPGWITNLTQTYDPLIRSQDTGMSAWQTAASNIIVGMCNAVNSQITSTSAALQFIYNQMIAQAATVKQFTTGYTVSPVATNTGRGNVVLAMIRADGINFQNVIPEIDTLTITGDSYTGRATRGAEPWSLAGQPNLSTLGTGNPVNIYDWDWPAGSGILIGGNAVAANQYGSSAVNGNILTNGDFATWTGSPAALSYWNLVTGAWGSTIQQNNTNQLGGTYCVRFNSGSTNVLTQQFGSGVATGVTAGTSASLSAYSGYLGNLWLSASGTLSAGTMVVSLVNSSGVTINDQSGNANTISYNLAGLSTVYNPYSYAFRLPTMLPSDGIIRLKISVSGLSGGNLYWDWNALTAPTTMYLGGPNIALFSNPAYPFVAFPTPDQFLVTLTNNWGGSTYLASFQSLFNRLFQTPGLILPYAASPSISDSLITAA